MLLYWSPFRSTNLSALVRGNVLLQGHHVRDGFDVDEVYANNDAGQWSEVASHLQPTSGSSAQVHNHTRLLQELVLSIQLDQLEGRPGAVPSLLCQVVEPVFPALS